MPLVSLGSLSTEQDQPFRALGALGAHAERLTSWAEIDTPEWRRLVSAADAACVNSGAVPTSLSPEGG